MKIISMLSLAFGVLLSYSASATLLEFEAVGTDNIASGFIEDPSRVVDTNDPSANFFRIHFISGEVDEFIRQITFNLATEDPDAIFDPSDNDPNNDLNGGGKGFGPIIGALTTGLNASDIRFSLDANSGVSSLLTVFFGDNSFNIGDTFSFGIDIDRLNADSGLTHQAGGLLGARSVGISAQLANSCQTQVSGAFTTNSVNRSSERIEICSPSSTAFAISEPSSLTLILISMLGVVFFRPQRKNQCS